MSASSTGPDRPFPQDTLINGFSTSAPWALKEVWTAGTGAITLNSSVSFAFYDMYADRIQPVGGVTAQRSRSCVRALKSFTPRAETTLRALHTTMRRATLITHTMCGIFGGEFRKSFTKLMVDTRASFRTAG